MSKRVLARPTHWRQLSVVATLAFLALGSLSLRAQEATSEVPLFGDSINVRLVNIEVVVTDRDRNRVSDLTADDFELQIDGQVTAFRFFSEIQEGVARSDAPAQGANGSQIQDTSPLGVVPGEPIGTQFLVFIDDALTVQRNRNRVLKKLEEQLDQRGPADQVAVVAFDGKQLEGLSPWTRDSASIRATLEEARARPARGAMAIGALDAGDEFARDRNFLEKTQEQLLDTGSATNPVTGEEVPVIDSNFDREPGEDVLTGFATGPDQATARSLTNTVERGIDAAIHAMRSTGAPAGRKVMLMVLGNWPLSPAAYVANRFGNAQIDISTAALDQSYVQTHALYDPLTSTANLLGYTLYPIDVPGNSKREGWDAATSPDQYELDEATSGAGGGTPDRETNVHAAFDHMARATGGLSLINSLRDQPFTTAFEDTRSFYWIGFTPERLGTDATQRVKLRIKNQDNLTVRYRGSFVDRSRSTEQELAIEGALLFAEAEIPSPAGSPAGQAGGTELTVIYGEPVKAKGRRLEVPVEVGIPMQSVTLLQQQGRFRGQLEVRFLVADESGNQSEITVDEIPINGRAAPQPGQLLWYETRLVLKRRSHKVVTLVHDVLGGATLTHSVNLEP